MMGNVNLFLQNLDYLSGKKKLSSQCKHYGLTDLWYEGKLVGSVFHDSTKPATFELKEDDESTNKKSTGSGILDYFRDKR